MLVGRDPGNGTRRSPTRQSPFLWPAAQWPAGNRIGDKCVANPPSAVSMNRRSASRQRPFQRCTCRHTPGCSFSDQRLFWRRACRRPTVCQFDDPLASYPPAAISAPPRPLAGMLRLAGQRHPGDSFGDRPASAPPTTILMTHGSVTCQWLFRLRPHCHLDSCPPVLDDPPVAFLVPPTLLPGRPPFQWLTSQRPASSRFSSAPTAARMAAVSMTHGSVTLRHHFWLRPCCHQDSRRFNERRVSNPPVDVLATGPMPVHWPPFRWPVALQPTSISFGELHFTPTPAPILMTRGSATSQWHFSSPPVTTPLSTVWWPAQGPLQRTILTGIDQIFYCFV